MELLKFSVQRFRNLTDVEMTPATGMNVIDGENAQGKTNLLEAIYVLSMLRSFRTRQMPEMVQFGEQGFLIQGSIQRGQSRHSLAVALEKGEKAAVLDHKKADALQYLGVFHVFLFSYPLLEVVRGGPEERRRFLDRAIAMSKPGYLQILMQYHRAMKQKNALLIQLQRDQIGKKEGIDEIQSFNQQLLEHGQAVVRERAMYLGALQELLGRKQKLFFEESFELGIELKSAFFSSPQELRKSLEKNMDREIARGTCLIGIHRDEVHMTLNGIELRKYGSSGQHRAYLLLLLLAQIQLYEDWRGDRPVLLLDDLDSELDSRRIQAFLGEIRERYQTFISSSRRELFAGHGTVCLFQIESGKLLEM